MIDPLIDQYSEPALYIQDAVKKHSEDCVIEYYHLEITQLGVITNIPDTKELPFYDSTVHQIVTGEQLWDYHTALGEFPENLPTESKFRE